MESEDDEDADLMGNSGIIDDVYFAMRILHQRFPREIFPNVVPMILNFDIYEIIEDRLSVATETTKLVSSHVCRQIRLRTRLEDIAFVFEEDLLEYLKKKTMSQNISEAEKLVLEIFSEDIIPSCCALDISSIELESIYTGRTGLSSSEIRTILIRNGLLIFKSASDFWFCVPESGSFISALQSTRDEICNVLRKKKYNEIPSSELEKAKGFSLPPSIVLPSMIASGLISFSESSAGRILFNNSDQFQVSVFQAGLRGG